MKANVNIHVYVLFCCLRSKLILFCFNTGAFHWNCQTILDLQSFGYHFSVASTWFCLYFIDWKKKGCSNLTEYIHLFCFYADFLIFLSLVYVDFLIYFDFINVLCILWFVKNKICQKDNKTGLFFEKLFNSYRYWLKIELTYVYFVKC